MNDALAVLATLLLPASLWAAPADDSVKVFPVDEVDSVSIDTSRGDISVTGTSRLTLRAELTKAEAVWDCKIVMKPSKDGKTILLSAKNLNRSQKDGCLAGFRVELPGRLSARAVSGTGDIESANVDGDFSAETGTGDIRLKNLTGAVHAKSGAGAVSGELSAASGAEFQTGVGSVKLRGLAGPVSVKTGTGEVSLAYASAPTAVSTTTISSGVGGAYVYLPEGAKVRTIFKSGSGHLTDEVGSTPDAAFVLEMRSGSGSLKVSKMRGQQ